MIDHCSFLVKVIFNSLQSIYHSIIFHNYLVYYDLLLSITIYMSINCVSLCTIRVNVGVNSYHNATTNFWLDWNINNDYSMIAINSCVVTICRSYLMVLTWCIITIMIWGVVSTECIVTRFNLFSLLCLCLDF